MAHDDIDEMPESDGAHDSKKRRRPIPEYAWPASGLRLAELRRARGLSRADLAAALDISSVTVRQNETGPRPMSKDLAIRYARFFNTSTDFLLLGRKRGPTPGVLELPLVGKVGAGARVNMPEDVSGDNIIDRVPFDFRSLALLQVEGDSLWPRLMAGDYVMIESEPVPPDRLVGQHAVVQCDDDGRLLIKLIERDGLAGFKLVSHNAPPITDVQIRAAWRVVAAVYR